LHVFANIVTPYGTAANNRGETEGNVTTLQKLIWMGLCPGGAGRTEIM
jgi:CRISPR-associated protein Cst2